MLYQVVFETHSHSKEKKSHTSLPFLSSNTCVTNSQKETQPYFHNFLLFKSDLNRHSKQVVPRDCLPVFQTGCWQPPSSSSCSGEELFIRQDGRYWSCVVPRAPILTPIYANGCPLRIYQLCLLHKELYKFTNIRLNNDTERCEVLWTHRHLHLLKARPLSPQRGQKVTGYIPGVPTAGQSSTEVQCSLQNTKKKGNT